MKTWKNVKTNECLTDAQRDKLQSDLVKLVVIVGRDLFDPSDSKARLKSMERGIEGLALAVKVAKMLSSLELMEE